MPTTMTILRSAIAAAILFSGVSANAALNGKSDVSGSTVRAEKPADLFARKGADDRSGHSRRGRGRDDGPNHAFLLKLPETGGVEVARRGADDAAGHTRHGRGTDDATSGHQHRGRGSDDGKGHGRHGRGSDDAAGDDHGGRRS